MAEYNVNISIDPLLDNIAFNEVWIKNLVIKISGNLKLKPQTEIDVYITDNRVIKKLNQEYRGINKPTDVLSFNMLPKLATDEKTEFVVPPDGITHLGEIIISYEFAQSQARENKIAIKHEMAVLIIHGLLHLLGYDHKLTSDLKRMRHKERLVIASLEPGLKNYNIFT